MVSLYSTRYDTVKKCLYPKQKEGFNMNKKWNEKTKFEKTLDIISAIAICVWLIFEHLERKNTVSYAETAAYISIIIVCICQAISYWNVKRVFSYIAIAGITLLAVVVILEALLLAS